MIITLQGEMAFRAGRFFIIDVKGVGYKVFAGPETLQKLTQKSGEVKVFTSLYVRETALELYGFLTFAELELFETLNAVPGVGPKTALGILGVGSIDMLKKAIASGETNYMTKVSGIGRKTAEKIVVELREKMGKGIEKSEEFQEEEDALEALRSLGYSLREARDALAKVPQDVKGARSRIRSALNNLGNTK